MKNNMQKTKSAVRGFRRGAFDLMSILAAVAILAIVGLVAVPKISAYIKGTQTSTLSGNVNTLNDFLATLEAGGVKYGTTYAAGSLNSPGTLRSDSATNLLTDLQAGVITYGSGSELVKLDRWSGTSTSYTVTGTPPRFAAAAGATAP